MKMRVPWHGQGGRNSLALLLAAAALTAHALPRGPQPDVRLQLSDFGFPGIPQGFQDSGASMLTVHFVDSAHLLLTYSMRGLVERIPGDPPDDDDRAVAALLVELPSGKVLSRTRWHLHDHGQYLWNVGSGRFLLRVGSSLTAIAPLANLASGDAFREMPFVGAPGRIDAVLIAPEHDLLTVESEFPHKTPKASVYGDGVARDSTPVELFSFIRITGSGAPGSPIRAFDAGSASVLGIGGLPVNGRGYLFSEGGKRDHWTMQYEGFDGKARKLSDIDSSCPPHMQFVSPSQFVVFSCRGSKDNLTLSAYDFAPHEMWEEPMSGIVPFEQFAYAQTAGRFALSRTTSSAGATDLSSSGPVVFGRVPSSAVQEVRVYQVESGDLLLKLACSPTARAGQNFDLSPDGLNIIAVRDGTIEEYHLPPLTAQDQKDLAQVQQYEPPINSSPVQLRHIFQEVPDTESAGGQQAVTPSAAAPTVNTSPSAPTSAAANSGDAEPHRKPPTLLNPGESVDGKRPTEQ